MRATLLVVLVAAQSLAVAHEFSHWDHSVQELCATCSLTSNLDDNVTVDDQRLALACTGIPDTDWTHIDVVGDVRVGYTPRAPPFSL